MTSIHLDEYERIKILYIYPKSYITNLSLFWYTDIYIYIHTYNKSASNIIFIVSYTII